MTRITLKIIISIIISLAFTIPAGSQAARPKNGVKI